MIHSVLSESEIDILSPFSEAEFTCSTGHLLFSERVLDFTDALSRCLLNDKLAKQIPELVALGFWLRRANLHRYQQQISVQPNIVLKPLGLVTHFTPSNVDTMFIYSWVCSMLSGNANIVRLSQVNSQSKDIVLRILTELLLRSEFNIIKNTNLFITYQHNAGITENLSLCSDARMIWGSDETVRQIRSLPCKVTCRDIVFADKYSACVVNGDHVSSQADVAELSKKLKKDIVPFEQAACSSCKVVFWQGDRSYREQLLDTLNGLCVDEHNAVYRRNNLLNTEQLLASQGVLENANHLTNLSAFVLVDFTPEIMSWHYGDRCLFIIQTEDLQSLILRLRGHCQTLSYWGFDAETINDLANESSLQAVDRIVPVGTALDFTPHWDGYDLFTQLTRTIPVV